MGDPVEVSSCGEMGGGGGGDGRSKELERLRAERDELDARIRLLESELEAGSAAPVSPEAGVGDGGCVGGGGACQARPGLAHDDSLPADMIYRYSRHLLLPDFGVEGLSALSSTVHLLGELDEPAL